MTTESPRFEGWHALEKLGEGGQGVVYRAQRAEQSGERSSSINIAYKKLRHVLKEVEKTEGRDSGPAHDYMQTVFEAVHNWIQLESAGLGAVKDFKVPDDGDEAKEVVGRLKKEVECLGHIQHPAILLLLGANTGPNRHWMATEYHPQGTLRDSVARFRGRARETLEAFRPLVEGVSMLHKQQCIHRDIKPENIFVATDGRLVLGDFGIVFYHDDEKSRLTETYERVGTRDWMAPWANVNRRLEDVRPSFDIFPLGKVLWFMLSGQRNLPFWYHRRKEFDIEKLFPDDRYMSWINELLDRCVVEDESNCCSAEELLTAVDEILEALRRGGEPLADALRPCHVCGKGNYQLGADESRPSAIADIGLRPNGLSYRVFFCDACGHVQFFRMFESALPPRAWRRS